MTFLINFLTFSKTLRIEIPPILSLEILISVVFKSKKQMGLRYGVVYAIIFMQWELHLIKVIALI